MAIDFFNRYPQNSGAKTTEYPFGSFRNETAPDAKDGTTLEQDWSNDFFALFWKLLVEAGITPSGNPDDVQKSQFYDALLFVIQREKTKVSNALDGTRTDVASSENALRQAYENAVASVKKAGDTMTGNLVMQASTQYRDISIPQNNVGSQFNIKNESGNLVIRRGRADGNASGEQRIVMPNRSGQVALVGDGLGVDQTWVDVTSQRNLNTDYLNDTGKPIFLSLSFPDTDRLNAIARVYVNNIKILENQYDTVERFGTLCASIIVPSGATYRVENIVKPNVWAELR